MDDEDIFYPWECLSIFRSNFTTLDLQIKDYHHLLALMHVLHKNAYKIEADGFMKVYIQLKYKMKMAYMAWSRDIPVATLFRFAVLKTL